LFCFFLGSQLSLSSLSLFLFSYHKACDTTDNIDQALLTRLAKVSANTLENVAEQDNLRAWLQGNP
jgi:hypothetical protein